MLPFLMEIYGILGFVAHLCREVTTGHMRRGWQDISNYTIGFGCLFPLSLFMFDYLEDDIKGVKTRYAVSYVLSGISFGAGVIVGHWYRPVKDC
jgi:hypothetical protein